MLIGTGGYSKVWHPPRKDRVIDKKFRGNDKYIQRLTNESFTEITHGQYARSIFDPKDKLSSPLVAVYERPSNSYSEIRPYRDDDFHSLLIKNIGKDNLELFCKICKDMCNIMEGLATLHKHGWIHHDIKSQNLLINKKPFHVFLIDWGTSTRLLDVYSAYYYNWLTADNSNHPPEFKSYAHYKYHYQFHGDDFAEDYANNFYLFTLLKIQPNYIAMLNKANQHLQKLFRKKGDAILKSISPKSDVFALGLVFTQAYLIMASSKLFGTSLHEKMIRLLKGMTHPDPMKRWSMQRSVDYLSPLVPSICNFAK